MKKNIKKEKAQISELDKTFFIYYSAFLALLIVKRMVKFLPRTGTKIFKK
jgi:hypothetical protein